MPPGKSTPSPSCWPRNAQAEAAGKDGKAQGGRLLPVDTPLEQFPPDDLILSVLSSSKLAMPVAYVALGAVSPPALPAIETRNSSRDWSVAPPWFRSARDSRWSALPSLG